MPQLDNVATGSKSLVLTDTETTVDLVEPKTGLDYLKDLVARNVVAGRVSLYEYDLDFAADFTETE